MKGDALPREMGHRRGHVVRRRRGHGAVVLLLTLCVILGGIGGAARQQFDRLPLDFETLRVRREGEGGRESFRVSGARAPIPTSAS